MNTEDLERKFGIHQSRLFMTEIIPMIYECLHWHSYATILDVGASTGGGTALLQELFHVEAYTELKLKVSALDILPRFQAFAQKEYPEVDYIVADIQTITSRSFDLVTASHVIEHVDQPIIFLDELRRATKTNVIVSCPFNEEDRIPGHLNTIGMDFIKETKPLRYEIYNSPGWCKGPCVRMIY